MRVKVVTPRPPFWLLFLSERSYTLPTLLSLVPTSLFFVIFFSGYTCALQKDILYQGRMFVSNHWICFHSKVFGKDTKVPAQPLQSEPFLVCCFPADAFVVCQIAIPVVSVTHIKKTKTAILVPNALVIATENDKVRRSHHYELTAPISDWKMLKVEFLDRFRWNI